MTPNVPEMREPLREQPDWRFFCHFAVPANQDIPQQYRRAWTLFKHQICRGMESLSSNFGFRFDERNRLQWSQVDTSGRPLPWGQSAIWKSVEEYHERIAEQLRSYQIGEVPAWGTSRSTTAVAFVRSVIRSLPLMARFCDQRRDAGCLCVSAQGRDLDFCISQFRILARWVESHVSDHALLLALQRKLESSDQTRRTDSLDSPE